MGNSYRQDQIYAYILRKGSASVTELADNFQVTATTIRRDLLGLEEQDVIYRTRGAAFLRGHGYAKAEVRDNVFSNEKKRIAAAAARYVAPNTSIIIDSGSSTAVLADHLLRECPYDNLDFITHSLDHASKLSKRFNVSMPGGYLTPNTEFLIGLNVENFYQTINADIAFLGSNGVRNCSGLTISYPTQIQVKYYASHCAEKRIALLDSSKFSQRGVYVFCDFKDLDILITVQTEENKAQLERIADQGVEIVLV